MSRANKRGDPGVSTREELGGQTTRSLEQVQGTKRCEAVPRTGIWDQEVRGCCRPLS